jgi:ubiquinone/menaquinone biosynthesis C-methylase UbiE
VERRIEAERLYHEDYYRRRDAPLDVDFSLALAARRRPQNLTWTYYDTLVKRLGGSVAGKKILMMGCGLGLTALNLAKQGATVSAFDVSPAAIEVCRRRAARAGLNIEFFVAACEAVCRAPGGYDAVAGEMILHHVDIPLALRAACQHLKPMGVGLFMEWKRHEVLDPVVEGLRSLRWFRKLLPAGGTQGYATPYERKLTAADLAEVRAVFPTAEFTYRYCFRGKIDYFSFPVGDRIERLDYVLLRLMPAWLRRKASDAVIIAVTKTGQAKLRQ